MLLIGSANAEVGMDEGWDLLSAGAAALDAVEAVVRAVEDNPADHTVGYGGYPGILGDVELDASVMDGTSRRAGAVGALREHRHAVTVARQVLDQLPHVLVVADGAGRLARRNGMVRESLLTPEAESAWRAGLEGRLPEAFRTEEHVVEELLAQATHLATDPDSVPGTVNVIARDRDGRLASAVSTSGWAWKYPGRLGDSPLIGAGNYADDRFGAAACTGWGELAIRCGTTRMIVAWLAQDRSVLDACRLAYDDIADLPDLPAGAVMSTIAVSAAGSYSGVSSVPGGTYIVHTEAMSQCEVLPRQVLSLAGVT
jgi:beta-aspartyl-peptidase (threonine type)